MRFTSMRKALALSLSLALLAALPALGETSYTTLPAPELMPQRVLLGWSEDPATTQTVTWRTGAPCAAAQAQVVRWSGLAKFSDDAATVQAVSAVTDLGRGEKAHTHEAVLRGLEPGTAYGYRVGDGTVWGEWHRFQTAAASPEPFRFLYFGDTQSEILSKTSRVIREGWRRAPDARFMVFAGDLVNHGYDDGLWNEWCAMVGFIGASLPSMATPGNHDVHRTDEDPEGASGVKPVWRAQFAAPLNGPEGLASQEETSYYLDFQGTRLISIDGNLFSDHREAAEAREKTHQWLEGVLKDNPNRWTMVVQHQPVYSTGGSRDNKEMRKALAPLYEKYGVDFVMQGHDHYYGRTHKVAGEKTADPAAKGPVYVVSVACPKMYEKNDRFDALMAITLGGTQLYQVIDVNNDRLRYESWSVGGELVDAFELAKDAAGATVYKDLAPGK